MGDVVTGYVTATGWFFKGRVKVGFEEVFNFELNVWINCGNK